MARRLERLPRFHGGAAAEADAAAALQEELAESDAQLERLLTHHAAPKTPPPTPAASAEAAEAPASAEAPRRPRRWTPALNAAVVDALGPALTGKIGALHAEAPAPCNGAARSAPDSPDAADAPLPPPPSPPTPAQ